MGKCIWLLYDLSSEVQSKLDLFARNNEWTNGGEYSLAPNRFWKSKVKFTAGRQDVHAGASKFIVVEWDLGVIHRKMASDGGRCRQNTEAGNDDDGGISGGGEDHAQAAASETGAVDGRLYSWRADVHHHGTDGERFAARVPSQTQRRHRPCYIEPYHWHGCTGTEHEPHCTVCLTSYDKIFVIPK